jgi:hypothetical protein
MEPTLKINQVVNVPTFGRRMKVIDLRYNAELEFICVKLQDLHNDNTVYLPEVHCENISSDGDDR